MNIFLLRDVPDEITKEDVENAFSEFGSVEYVKTQPRSPNLSGRMVIVKMAKVDGETFEVGKPYKVRRLRLVKPRSKETIDQEREIPLPVEKSANPLRRAFEYALQLLRRGPLAARVKVSR